MKIIYLNPNVEDVLPKKVEIIQYNGRNYIEFAQYENIEHIVDLAISLAKENEVLKERLQLLQDKLDALVENRL